VLRDVTTSSLTHFEPVRSWSLAEELTPIEIWKRTNSLSRHRRMTAADYPGDRSVRSLVNIQNPGLRSSALWFAHSVMASSTKTLPTVRRLTAGQSARTCVLLQPRQARGVGFRPECSRGLTGIAASARAIPTP